MKVERFFHLRTGGTRGGACVRVTGHTDMVGQVDVQTVFCSKKDPYCKKTGRTLATDAPVKIIPLRYLPGELARIQDTTIKKAKTNGGLMPSDFGFSIRYFLPKE